MIEDMRIRGMGDKAQKSHIRAIKNFAAFLGRSPDTATPEDLRAYQLHMTDAWVTPSTCNTRIVALRLLFSMTCGCEEMKRYMRFRNAIHPRRHQDDPRHCQPLRDAGQAAGSDREAKPGMTCARRAPAKA
jgi:hypothetical protein